MSLPPAHGVAQAEGSRMGDTRGRRGSALPAQAAYPAISSRLSRGDATFLSPGDSDNEDIEPESETGAGGKGRYAADGGGGGGRARERPDHDRGEGRAVRGSSRDRPSGRKGVKENGGQSGSQRGRSSGSGRDLTGERSTSRRPNGAGVGGGGVHPDRDGVELNGGRRGSQRGSADGSGRGLGGEGSSGRSLASTRTGGGSGPIQSQEPTMKSHGCMTAATAMKLTTLGVALLNVAILWSRDYDSRAGGLCLGRGRRCVDTAAEMALISLAKLAAGALYPSIVCSIISKCYATRYFLHHSWLALIVDLEPTHKLHTYFGLVTLLCSVVHAACHVALSAVQRRPGYLLKTTVNRSGLAALLLLLAVALPMSVGLIRAKVTYEVRKTLHLLTIPFMVAICFHGRPLQLLGAVLLVWYLVDRLYFTTKMTFLIDSPSFKAVGRGTLVRFELPPGYQYKPGAYVQVNCPAISASEWHPFSLFPVPGPRARAGFHVEAVGDWTNEMFSLCLENPRMQLWITAAQPSVAEQAVYYDNVVLVCTGAGITPAVSVAERFSKEKNLHLLWMCRDAGMVAMFEKQVREVSPVSLVLAPSTVYLTGKQPHKTRRRVVDLLAPQRADVVAATTGGGARAPCSKPGLRSLGDLADLEAGAAETDESPSRSPATMDDFRGLLRDDDNVGCFLSSRARSPSKPSLPSCLPESQMLSRLNTGQRISKRDLMEADLSVVNAHPSKGSVPSGKKPGRDVEGGTWLVLYCGANANVEQAVASASDRLQVTWRKEYFNKW
ncbi:unnamed protein product [Scytosiphon promiscuus]